MLFVFSLQCVWTKTFYVQAGLKEENARVTPPICWQTAREAVECVVSEIDKPYDSSCMEIGCD